MLPRLDIPAYDPVGVDLHRHVPSMFPRFRLSPCELRKPHKPMGMVSGGYTTWIRYTQVSAVRCCQGLVAIIPLLFRTMLQYALDRREAIKVSLFESYYSILEH